MAYIVPRPNLNWKEKIYLPSIVAGMMITIKHLIRMLKGQTKVVMQYPEEKWDSHLPDHYRGAPTLVTDDHGRERCVASSFARRMRSRSNRRKFLPRIDLRKSRRGRSILRST